MAKNLHDIGISAKEMDCAIKNLIACLNEYGNQTGPATLSNTDISNSKEDLEISEQIVISKEFANLIDLL